MNKEYKIIICLGAMLIFSYMKMSGLSREIDDLSYQLEDIKYKVEDMYNVESKEEKSNSLVNTTNFNIKEVDDNSFITHIQVDVEFNRLSQNSEPVFVYKETESSNWNEVDLENKGILAYSCNIQLDQKKNYEYKVITKGEMQESSEVQEISESDYTGSLHSWSVEGISNGGYYITLFDPYSRRGVEREEFLVEGFYVEVKTDNGADKYEFEKSKRSDIYELDLKKKYLKDDKYKIDLVVKYKNSLEKRYDIN